jgi:uncharacterized protein
MSPAMRVLAMTVMMLVAMPAGAVPVELIPSPRPQGWVVDQTGKLSEAAVRDLNLLGDHVHRHDGAEIAIVVIASVDGADPRTFATQLFNRWGIGDRQRNNGILLLAALDDRAAEIVLGDGVDSNWQIEASQRIMDTLMVPRFRDDDPGGAMVHGARACASMILGINLTQLQLETAAKRWWHPILGEELISTRSGVTLGACAVTGLGAVMGVRRLARYRPRKCPNCASPLTLLGPEQEQEHLHVSQLVEQRLGSVDYDVWSCDGCHYVMQLSYGALFTRYAKCPQCGAKTVESTSTTEQPATYSSTGVLRVDEHCAHCGHHASRTRTIPRLVESSSSSSGSSGSSSFGGGSSSGSGASGRW